MKHYILTSDNQIFDTAKYKIREFKNKIVLSVAGNDFTFDKTDIVKETDDIRDLSKELI